MNGIGTLGTTSNEAAGDDRSLPGVDYRPWRYFGIVLAITWIPGFVSAWLSTTAGTELLQFLLLVPGLFAPLVATLVMMGGRSSRALRRDYWARLSPRRIRPGDLLIILLTMPFAAWLAVVISVNLGGSPEQFQLSSEFSLVAGQSLLSVAIIFLAPTIEELGWRGYGVDSLRSRFNLFSTCLVFAVLWGLWHLPLFFINGYYNNQLLGEGPIYVANWVLQLAVASFLINWVYDRNRRTISAAILLHLSLVLFAELYRMEPSTKLLVTAVLLAIVAVVVAVDRRRFFGGVQDRSPASVTPAQVAG